jgi:hypothetical protein
MRTIKTSIFLFRDIQNIAPPVSNVLLNYEKINEFLFGASLVYYKTEISADPFSVLGVTNYNGVRGAIPKTTPPYGHPSKGGEHYYARLKTFPTKIDSPLFSLLVVISDHGQLPNN